MQANRWKAFIIFAIVVAVIIGAAVLFVGSRQQETQTQRDTAQSFLQENAEEQGVNVTDSGLQYRVIAEGDGGAKPTLSSRVTVHYVGRLTDGTQFDSSYDRGQPITFPLGNVIAGWQEGLQLMSVGSHYELVIPPDLGYGASGIPGAIPPNAVLIFEVELLGIE